MQSLWKFPRLPWDPALAGSSSACRYGVECTASWWAHGGIKVGILGLGERNYELGQIATMMKCDCKCHLVVFRFRFHLRYEWFSLIYGFDSFQCQLDEICLQQMLTRQRFTVLIVVPRTLVKSIGRGLHILKVSWWPANMAPRLPTLMLETYRGFP